MVLKVLQIHIQYYLLMIRLQTFYVYNGADGEDGADGTQADWNAVSGLAVILNKPTIPTVPSIVNNLTTETTGSTLDATQGKTLNDKIVALNRTPTALKRSKLYSCLD